MFNFVGDVNPGDRIQVSVWIYFDDVAWCTPWFFGGVKLSTNCIMRKEAP
jgi:hypothetical protein